MVAVLAVTCKQYKEVSASQPTTSRQLRPNEVARFHASLEIKIAWVPYEENQVVEFEDSQYIFKYDDGVKSGRALPMIVIDHPYGDSILIEMDIDNELLGKLIKRSIMTQKPIERPFTKYFDEARCQSCHPSDIKVSLD